MSEETTQPRPAWSPQWRQMVVNTLGTIIVGGLAAFITANRTLAVQDNRLSTVEQTAKANAEQQMTKAEMLARFEAINQQLAAIAGQNPQLQKELGDLRQELRQQTSEIYRTIIQLKR